jgi:hypothetical protein
MRAFVGLTIAVCVAIAIGVVIVWAAGPLTYGPSAARFTARFPGPVETRIASAGTLPKHLPRRFGISVTQYRYIGGTADRQLIVAVSVTRLPAGTRSAEGASAGYGYAGPAAAGLLRSTTFDGHPAEIATACSQSTPTRSACSAALTFPTGAFTFRSSHVSWLVTANAPTEDVALEMLLSVQPAN